MVLLRVESAAAVDALLYAETSDAASAWPLRPVAHWALPNVDVTAAEERMNAVRSSAIHTKELLDSLPENLAGDENAQIGQGDERVRESVEEQRECMLNVTTLMNDHYRVHEETQQLLKAVNPDSALALRSALDALEHVNEEAEPILELDAQAMKTSLDSIADALASSAKATPKRKKKSLFRQQTATEMMHSVKGDTRATTSKSPSPVMLEETEVDDDEAWEHAQKVNRELEEELALSQKMLHKARGQLISHKLSSQKMRMPGGRLTDVATQTDPLHALEVQKSLNDMLAERDEQIKVFKAELDNAHDALGNLRKPITAIAASVRLAGDKSSAAKYLLKYEDIESRTKEIGTMVTPKILRSQGGAAIVRSSSANLGEQAQEGHDEEAVDSVEAIVSEDWQRERERYEKRITELSATDHGRVIAMLQDRIERMQEASKEILSSLPMHLYAPLRATAMDAFELGIVDLQAIEQHLSAGSGAGVNPLAAIEGIVDAEGVAARINHLEGRLERQGWDVISAVLDGVVARTADRVVYDSEAAAATAAFDSELARRIEIFKAAETEKLKEERLQMSLHSTAEVKRRVAEALTRTNIDANIYRETLAEVDEQLGATTIELERTATRLHDAEGQLRASHQAEATERKSVEARIKSARAQVVEALSDKAILLSELHMADSDLRNSEGQFMGGEQERAQMEKEMKDVAVLRAAVESEREDAIKMVAATQTELAAREAELVSLRAAHQIDTAKVEAQVVELQEQIAQLRATRDDSQMLHQTAAMTDAAISEVITANVASLALEIRQLEEIKFSAATEEQASLNAADQAQMYYIRGADGEVLSSGILPNAGSSALHHAPQMTGRPRVWSRPRPTVFDDTAMDSQLIPPEDPPESWSRANGQPSAERDEGTARTNVVHPGRNAHERRAVTPAGGSRAPFDPSAATPYIARKHQIMIARLDALKEHARLDGINSAALLEEVNLASDKLDVMLEAVVNAADLRLISQLVQKRMEVLELANRQLLVLHGTRVASPGGNQLRATREDTAHFASTTPLLRAQSSASGLDLKECRCGSAPTSRTTSVTLKEVEQASPSPSRVTTLRKPDGEWARKHAELMLRVACIGSEAKLDDSQSPRASSAQPRSAVCASAGTSCARLIGACSGGASESHSVRSGRDGTVARPSSPEAASPRGEAAFATLSRGHARCRHLGSEDVMLTELKASVSVGSLPTVRPMTPTTLAGLSSGMVSPSKLLSDSQGAIGWQQRQQVGNNVATKLDVLQTRPRTSSRDDSRTGVSLGRHSNPPRSAGAITGNEARGASPMSSSNSLAKSRSRRSVRSAVG